MSDIQDAALDYLNRGYSVIPVAENKRPLGLWREYQKSRMDAGDVQSRFTQGSRIAIVAGTVSGGLECIDFDDPAAFEPFLNLVKLRSSRLFDKLKCHKTPSGGYHILYRSECAVQGNQVFARDMAGKVRIESRGEGGYFLVPPSQGYGYLSGPKECAVLTAEEVLVIHDTAAVLDLKTQNNAAEKKMIDRKDSPGTRFNTETDPRELLLKYGWKPSHKTTAGEGWTRPGKDKDVSGVLLSSTGNFYCWTSNAAPLEPQKSYSPFALYAMYEHAADFSLAARTLKKNDIKNISVKKEDTESNARSLTVATIMRTHYRQLRWAVPDIIPEGMTVLAGRPKFGKSWLMLGLAYAISTGTRAWGYKNVKKASVHYLALEDSERRIQDRVRQMEGYFDEYPENLHIYTSFPRIGEGFGDELSRLIDRDPDVGLIIVDTLQKVRPLTGGKRAGSNLYQLEYEDYERVQKWSIENGVPVVCIHHTRKGTAGTTGNPFDEMSGSTGIQGVADTLIVVLKKDKGDIAMYVSGREVSEEIYPMTFSKRTMTWTLSAPIGKIDSTPFLLMTWWREHKSITVQDAAELWDTSQSTARRKLDELATEGALEKNKEGKQHVTAYYLKK